MKREQFESIEKNLGKIYSGKLVDAFGGQIIYIPKIDAIKRIERNKKIREEFRGANHYELAKLYNLTSSQVRNIVQSATPEQLPKSFLELERVLGYHFARFLILCLGGSEVLIPRKQVQQPEGE